MSNETRPLRVGLFVTCLVDFFRPSVGFAAVKLLEGAAVWSGARDAICRGACYIRGSGYAKASRGGLEAFQAMT